MTQEERFFSVESSQSAADIVVSPKIQNGRLTLSFYSETALKLGLQNSEIESYSFPNPETSQNFLLNVTQLLNQKN